MRALHHPAADVQRRRRDVVDPEPLESVDRADDVHDGVERPDFVKMHALDGDLVNRRLGLRETLEQMNRPVLSFRGQRRAPDRGCDFGQRMVMIVVVAGVIVVLVAGVIVAIVAVIRRGVRPLDQFELRRGDTRARDALRRHLAVLDREASEGTLQRVERQPEIQQRSEHHVAGRARETIEVEHHSSRVRVSFML